MGYFICMKTIYLDNAAAAPTEKGVQREMNRGMKIYGNPSSFNNAGRQASKELIMARLKIARFLGAHQEEIVFTSSGSEANNMAITGLASFAPKNKNEIITTQIEHLSVLEPVRSLTANGFKAIFVKINKDGLVDAEDVLSKINSKTLLVSVMYANNEIGTIEPINKIGKAVRLFRKNGSKFPVFHVDACQAAGYLNMNVNSIQADLLTFNGSKIGGPRGVGVLYVRKGTVLAPFVLGGGQERGLRAGTENLPAILGLAKAVELINKKETGRLGQIRDYFINRIKEIDSDIKLNGAGGNDRLPNNINISIPKLDSENLLLELDKYGISAGSGSACTSRSVEPSHVLRAIGVKDKYLSGALRFSMGKQTTKKDIDYVLKVLPRIIYDLKKRYRK